MLVGVGVVSIVINFAFSISHNQNCLIRMKWRNEISLVSVWPLFDLCLTSADDPEPKACQYQGAEVPHGELWVVNPCKSCKCEFGKVNCFTESCSTLTCSNKVKVPGQCCRICVGKLSLKDTLKNLYEMVFFFSYLNKLKFTVYIC